MPKKLEPSVWKSHVPPGMRALPQWVGWSTGQGRKVPKQLKTGRSAKANDPATWGSWEEAQLWYEQHRRDPTRGCGFVFKKGSGLVFVDVDDCLTAEGKLKDWAEPLIRPFIGHTYVERSPGGNGLHIFAIANFPPGVVKTGATWKLDKLKRDSVAVFDDRRFSTLTGDVFEDSRVLMPCQPLFDELLARTGLAAKLGGPEAEPEPGDEVTSEDLANLQKALDATDPDLPYDQWIKVGMALRGLGDVGFKMWDQWSRRGRKYQDGVTKAKWAGFKPEGVGLGSVFHVAEEEGGFSLRTSAQDDFASFKGAGADDDLLGERYESGSMMKWKALGLRLVAKGVGKNITVRPAKAAENIGFYFEGHDRWKGQLRFNLRTRAVDSMDGEPVDAHELLRHVNFFLGWDPGASKEQVAEVLRDIAARCAYDPVKEWLSELKWDGVERVDGLLGLVGLENTERTRRHMRRWMIGAVARAFKPGCKMQNMLVLHGAQGRQKSAFFERLAVKDEWYSESQLDMHNKDGQLMMLAPWIVENAELDSLSRPDMARVKNFISDRLAKFRKPYDRNVETHPRRSVLGGTTNEMEFLRDPTGSRRFWLIAALETVELRPDRIDEEMLAQLWAEAKAAFQKGERWWDDMAEVDEVIEANQDHYDGTALDGYVQAVLVDLVLRSVTTVQEVQLRLAEKFRVPTTTRSRDIGAAMRRAGWSTVTLRLEGLRQRFWRAPKTQDAFLVKAAEQALARVSESEFREEPE